MRIVSIFKSFARKSPTHERRTFSTIFAFGEFILLRSDIRLTPSEIALRAVSGANIISLYGIAVKYHVCRQENISHRAKRDISLHFADPIAALEPTLCAFFFGFFVCTRSTLRNSRIRLLTGSRHPAAGGRRRDGVSRKKQGVSRRAPSERDDYVSDRVKRFESNRGSHNCTPILIQCVF